MRTVDDVGRYLLERGLVEAADVVDGSLCAGDVSGRNRNLRVVRRDRRGYLIKQAGVGEPGTATTLRAEAAFYRLCWNEPALASMRSLMPGLVEESDEVATLVLELLAGAVPLWEHYAAHQPSGFPWQVGPLLGGALGQLHVTFRDPAVLEDPRLPGRTREVPWILTVHRPEPAILERLSPANLQLLKTVQSQPGLPENLDAARAEWRIETVIHGDIKSDNVLVRPAAGPEDEPRISLVDWELLQPGDPAWDVAAAFADFVEYWLKSVPLTSAKSAEQQVAEAGCPLSTIQPALRGLWNRYGEVVGLPHQEAGPFLVRTVRYSAARLIQAAYERSYRAAVLPNLAVGLLQVAANILADPVGSLWDVFGIPLPWSLAVRS